MSRAGPPEKMSGLLTYFEIKIYLMVARLAANVGQLVHIFSNRRSQYVRRGSGPFRSDGLWCLGRHHARAIAATARRPS